MSRFFSNRSMAPPAPAAASPVATVFKPPPAKTSSRPVAPPLKGSASPLQAVGFAVMLLFLYISSGRLTDYFLWQFHVPFVVSMMALAIAVFNRSLLSGLQANIGVMFAGFTIWLVLAIPTSTWRGGSVELVKDTWSKSLAAFVITAALIFTSRHVKSVIIVLSWGFLTAALLGFRYGISSDGRFYLSQGGYTGPNEYASAMVQGIICWAFLMQNRSSAIWWRILALVPIAPILVILSRTGSRAAFVSTIVVLLALFWRQSTQGKVIVAIIAAVGMIAATGMMSGTTKRRLLTIFQPAVTENMTTEEEDHLSSAVASTQGRLHLLRRSLMFTLQNPIFGVGPGMFAVAEDGLARTEGKPRGTWLGTHNTYTQISSETGIPGLVFYAGCMVFCWRGLKRTRNRVMKMTGPNKEQWLLIAFTLQLLLIHFAVFFCFAHIAYDPTFPLIAAIILAFIRAADDELGKTEKKNALTPVAT